MHHLIIGEFVFSVGDKTPLSRFNRTATGGFSEVPVLYGARSEFVGQALEKLEISAKWLHDVNDKVTKLRGLLNTPQQVSDGQGNSLGKWTVQAVGENKSAFIHNGQAMITEVNLSLMEYRNDSAS